MTYSIDLDPVTKQKIRVTLFRNVSNTSELRQQLINGNLQCCMLNPSLIVDPLQVIIAANKAVTSEKLKTRTIYTEILFNLSASKNISQSLQTFGISDNARDILVVVIDKNNENNEDIFKKIDGEQVDLSLLKEMVNVDSIKKLYKINDIEAKSIELLDSVVSRIAAKDCVL